MTKTELATRVLTVVVSLAGAADASLLYNDPNDRARLMVFDADGT